MEASIENNTNDAEVRAGAAQTSTGSASGWRDKQGNEEESGVETPKWECHWYAKEEHHRITGRVSPYNWRDEMRRIAVFNHLRWTTYARIGL